MKPARRFLTGAQPKPEREPLLTIEQIRDFLGLSSNQGVYRLVRKGMPVRRLGRSLRFDRAEVDAWSTKDRIPERPTVVLVRGA